jgi:hypothetical protein
MVSVSDNYPIAAILRDILSQISATFVTGLYGNCPYMPLIAARCSSYSRNQKNDILNPSNVTALWPDKSLLNQPGIIAIEAQAFSSQIQLPRPDSQRLLIAI